MFSEPQLEDAIATDCCCCGGARLVSSAATRPDHGRAAGSSPAAGVAARASEAAQAPIHFRGIRYPCARVVLLFQQIVRLPDIPRRGIVSRSRVSVDERATPKTASGPTDTSPRHISHARKHDRGNWHDAGRRTAPAVLEERCQQAFRGLCCRDGHSAILRPPHVRVRLPPGGVPSRIVKEPTDCGVNLKL